MRVPQEIVDAIIDYFGVPLDQPQSHDPIFYRWDLDKSILNSLALVSKGCNHRVRYYLFSHCKIIPSYPSCLQKFARCPDILLTYTRFLYICRPRNLEEIQSIIARFVSSNLIRIKFVSAQILAGFSTIFESFLPSVEAVHFDTCLFDPIILVKLREHRDLRQVAVSNCVASGILESIGDFKAGIPRRVPDGVGGTDEVVGCVLRSLRVLRLESTADPSENELIKASAKTLQYIEIKAKTDWRSSYFCLDLGACSKLRGITFEGNLEEASTIRNLVATLSTLQNPRKLWRIRVLGNNSCFTGFDADLEDWLWLDDLLCGIFDQVGEVDGDGLTFQVASRKTPNSLVPCGFMFYLLPKFSLTGGCEEVEV